MNTLDKQIIERLTQIECVEGVKILLAVESGSRVWGFESKNSDYDVRFIYIRPPSWYLSVFDRRDVLEYPLTEDTLDISGWDLRKALGLAYKGNPPLIEWLRSPKIYMEDMCAHRLRGLITDHFSAKAALYHYLKMAKGNYRTYLQADIVQLKKYFYVLRPLLACDYVLRTSSIPPLRFDDLWGSYKSDFPSKEVGRLLNSKINGEELDVGPKIPEINSWIEYNLELFEQKANLANLKNNSYDALDAFFCTTVLNPLGDRRKYS